MSPGWLATWPFGWPAEWPPGPKVAREGAHTQSQHPQWTPRDPQDAQHDCEVSQDASKRTPR